MVGDVYEVSTSSAERFRQCATLAEWYDAMGELLTLEPPMLESDDDELTMWAETFTGGTDDLAALFQGDLASPDQDNNDPVVRYAGPDRVTAAAQYLSRLSQEEVDARLGPAGCGWFKGSFERFLADVSANDNAVIMMWGG